MKTLGLRLKSAREKKHMTQMQAAGKLGISNGTLSGYERNYRDPDTTILKRMADLYGVDVDELLDRNTENTTNSELDLSDDDLIQKYDVVVDGKSLSETELREIISYVRVKRTLE